MTAITPKRGIPVVEPFSERRDDSVSLSRKSIEVKFGGQGPNVYSNVYANHFRDRVLHKDSL